MPRPKGVSPKSVKRIYSALIRGPLHFDEISTRAKLHRNTVGTALKELTKRGLVQRFREGHRTMYEIEKTKQDGWQIPWIAMMSTKKERELNYRHGDQEIEAFWRKRKLEQNARDFSVKLEGIVTHPDNQALIEAANEVKILITYKMLLENLKTPYCPECVKREKQFYHSIFNKESEEYVCPNCNLIVRQREPLITTAPANEEQRKMENYAKKARGKTNNTLYYRYIQELLEKYRK